jgi:hypothetical protein
MAKHRSHSIAFKCQVAQEFIASETLHGLAKRHNISRDLILPARSSLWPDIEPRNLLGSRGATAGKRLGYWLRGLGVTDREISPAHSRHWFIDACRAGQLHPEIRSALTGHSAHCDKSANHGAGMGSFIQLLAENIGKVRRPLPPVTSKAGSVRSPRGRPAVPPKMLTSGSTDSPQAPVAGLRGDTTR